MNQQKRNRLIAAGTVAIVLLLIVLVAIMVYQLVVIVNLNNRKQELQDKIDGYNQSINDYESQLDYYESYDGLFNLAIEYDIIGKNS